jgi:hypothetical protein
MNKLMLSALCATALLAFGSQANAGDRHRDDLDRHGRCSYTRVYAGRPVYDRCETRYDRPYRGYYGRPNYYYSRPGAYYYDGGYRTYYRPSPRYCTPRFGISFSFFR